MGRLKGVAWVSCLVYWGTVFERGCVQCVPHKYSKFGCSKIGILAKRIGKSGVVHKEVLILVENMKIFIRDC